MPRRPTLSPTKIAAYLECAMKYRYIYVDKIGRFYLRAHSYYSFGSTLHQVLQTFHEEGGVQSSEQMVEQYEQKWISAGYESPQQEKEYHAVGTEIVQAYHEAAAERAAQEVETLYVEKTISTDMGPFILTGRVDRIDRHADGTLEIVDYKSGRWETTTEEVASDLAMSIYQTIMRRLYPGTRILATIYCLRSGTQTSAELSDADAGTFAADLLALGEEIIHRDYENVEPARIAVCPSCEFLPRCERFWREQARRDI